MRRFWKDFDLYRRIIAVARPYWPHIAGFGVLSLLATPLTLLKPLPLKIAIDSVVGAVPLPLWLSALLPPAITGSDGGLLTFVAVFFVLIVGLSQLQGLAATLLKNYAGEKLVLDFRARIFRHVQRLSLAYHDNLGAADSTYRIQYDAPSIQNVTVSRFIPLLTSLVTLCSMTYVMARLDWQIALVALGITPVLFVLMRMFRTRLRRSWKQIKKLDSSANTIVQEVLSSVRLVKAFGREEHEQARFMDRSGQRVTEQLRVGAMQGLFDSGIALTIACGTAATLYLGVSHVQGGTLTVGELLIIMSYLGQLYDPLQSISKRLGDLQASLASVERAFDLLDELPEVEEAAAAWPLARARGEISFRDVGFVYPGGRRALRSVSLDVPAGARVGIQGRTGAGKSTLMSLLARFYDVSEGRILLDGVDIREYRLADLRNQFGIVLQDTVLFSTTIRENIAYGRPGAREEEIVRAARLADADRFVSRLPEAYDTLVGEKGMMLSGGERQRISLARAFLRDSPILILDEPTSSVDQATENAIMEALERLMQGRTTFMIAHRLSTLEKCDLRLVIEDGTLYPLYANAN